MNSAELRRNIRVPLRCVARIIVPGRGPIEAKTIDISEGGMSVAAPANPRPGTVFTIQFSFPSRQRDSVAFSSVVRVVQSSFYPDENAFRIGLFFVEMSEAAKKQLATFLV